MPAKAEPKLVELGVSYSYSIKADMGRYENATCHITRSEKWDVTGLSLDDASALWRERHDAQKEEVDALVEAEYAQLSQHAA